MDKNEKFTVARLFTDAAHLAGMTPRALVATLAGNTGIDQRQVDMVGRAGPARDIITALQELGRNCRRDGMRGRYLVHFSWGQVVTTALTILTAKDVNDPSRTASVNSAIAQRGSNTTQAPGGVDLAPLSKQQKTLNRKNALTYFLDFLRLYCLPGLGCIHAQTEWFSATG